MNSTAWDLTVNLRDVVLDFLWITTFILIGTTARRYLKFFQRFLVPNNLIGGFLLLLVSTQGLGWIDLDGDRLGIYTYHFLALTFIALGLRQEKKRWGRGPLNNAFASIMSYLIQGIIGLCVAFLVFYLLDPEMFLGLGLLVPLGFGMGPGVAYTMGHNWEQFGFYGGGEVGLTFAAIGYIYAFFLGMVLIRWGIKKRKTTFIKGINHLSKDLLTGVYKDEKTPVAGYLTLLTEAVEPMAFQLGLVGFVYLLTYLTCSLLSKFMYQAGLDQFVSTLWSFHFVIGLLIALIVRKLLDRTNRAYLIDTGLMTRSMGVFLDLLVVSAIAAISFPIVTHYWFSILVISVLVGPATLLALYWVCYRSFEDYHFERFLLLFGEMTGTINSALVLVRVTDPEFKTPVAEDAVYGSGLTLFLGFPLLIALNLPVTFFHNKPYGYWVIFGFMLFYLILTLLIWRLIGFLKFRTVYSPIRGEKR